MSLLSIEAYLAATRDEQLREQIADLAVRFRQRFGRWLDERGVPTPEETAAVLVAEVDGLLLHRGLGADPDAGPMMAVLRRLVSAARPHQAVHVNLDFSGGVAVLGEGAQLWRSSRRCNHRRD